MALAPDRSFRFFPRLNLLEHKDWMNTNATFGLPQYETLFQDDSLQGKVMQALGQAHLLPIKEILETFEYFACIRRDLRAPQICDLCCGHGLLGLLFAIFERQVERVWLVDKVEPPSRQKLTRALSAVAPWIESKIIHKNTKLTPLSSWLEPGMSIVSAHACGRLSDLCLDIALATGGKVAILPCCYPRQACQAPMALQQQLGFETATDIHRTYRLEQAGYSVRWDSIPAVITPMNRVLIGRKTLCNPRFGP